MADRMEFPKTMQEFVESYSFIDIDEVYTNGIMLVPTFRVEQAIEHYEKEIRNKAIDEFAERLKAESYSGYATLEDYCEDTIESVAVEDICKIAEELKGVQE